MNIAVKLYSEIMINRPTGIPLSWPAETILLGESTILPEETGWILMTEEEYSTYKEQHFSEYLIWEETVTPGVILQENYKVSEYTSSGLLLSTSWYQDKGLDGSYSNLSRVDTCSYLEGSTNIYQIDSITYDSKKNINRHEIKKFYTDIETNKVIEETEVL